jgi:fructose-1,6-bisphosphatase/inositol monophosphatase family enzyme
MISIEQLRGMQREIRDAIIRCHGDVDLHATAKSHAADTIYKIDAFVEPIIDKHCREWAKTSPLILIAEGIEGENGVEGAKIYPQGAKEEDAEIRLIVDPIDGTRGIMYDKRSAWSLAGVAPNNGPRTRLRDIEVAVMTELPTSKAGFADVLWATKGKGAQGVREALFPTLSPQSAPIHIAPSKAKDLLHGFGMIVDFFPGTKEISGEMMEFIARNLIGAADVTRPAVFEDQYISTGGQFYEMIVGHDRFNADLRPIFHRMQNQPEGLCCHPYDCATMLIAEEAGVILTDGQGHELDGPLDCTTGLSWAAFANEDLQKAIEPLMLQFFQRGERL